MPADELNKAHHRTPHPHHLPDLLLEQVRRGPDRLAVVSDQGRLTFRQTAERSCDLAAHLRRLGVAPDDRVGVFIEPSIELMVGTWGILFAGAAYLPLAPDYPEERLRYMISDARVEVIVCSESLAERLGRLAPSGTTVVALNNAARVATPHGETGGPSADPRLRPDHLAYVIYTSGSTGRPKGVTIEHRSIVNQMRWLTAAHGLDQTKVVLQKTPLSFDAAQWEILAPACGSRVVMGSPGIYRDPERLIDTIADYDVTTLQCVPTLLQALLDTEEMRHCRSLVQVFSGGEALSRSLATRFLDALPACELINLYGPTECTINSTSHTVDPAAANDAHTIPIGTPVDGTRCYVLDENRAPVAAGETGELYIGGVQLARGYLHRPELTAERFIDNPFDTDGGYPRLYRTGDRAYWNADGTIQFAGRVDNQVKVRGFRVELDEVRLAIETHHWVRGAAVVVENDPRTGSPHLAAFVELDPKEAALMDQGNHGAHHQSKASKLQVKAQLSQAGLRDPEDLRGRPALVLPGREATPEQRQQVFARKTYRFFEGGPTGRSDLLRLLAVRAPETVSAPRPAELPLGLFGEILRYFGAFSSEERLLPKYGYASPGALYATQMYLELDGYAGLASGHYYYHPMLHQLILIEEKPGEGTGRLKLHFVGKRRAIESVYKNNVREVLEIEAGHMVGLFEAVLPGYGLDIRAAAHVPTVLQELACAADDHYLGTFELVEGGRPRPDEELDIYVQSHPDKIADLPAGQYRYRDGDLERISDDLVLRRHVIAINQQVYERSSFGITIVSRAGARWRRYIDLGRKLQQLQMNDVPLGLMSSGYSSETGFDLPSARRLDDILSAVGMDGGPSYFAVGGGVSDEQLRGEGMKEDAVHMRGPTEIIRDDLVDFLPSYMMPSRVTVVDELPLAANGKIDLKALQAMTRVALSSDDRPVVAPRTATEARIGAFWRTELRRDVVSVQDDFFESGGNSLIAVRLVNWVNREFGRSLPLQVLFEAPTVERLALRVDQAEAAPSSRLVPLRTEGSRNPIYCWPGLGGYPMNLRSLAGRAGLDRPFYGVQALGINPGEEPYTTVREMAAADVELIRKLQPAGPYTLWGYSFGARVAFEAAYQLERCGEQVEHLFLIAPGAPRVRSAGRGGADDEPAYSNPAFVTILFSVFAGSITGPLLAECLRTVSDDESFISFISANFGSLDRELVRRIVRVVRQTFGFTYEFRELAERRVSAPVTIFRASGDDYSFIENSDGYSAAPPTVVGLEADHYGLLRSPHIVELVRAVRHRLRDSMKEPVMPHVNIKHFPVMLSPERQSELIDALTRAITAAFRCDEGAISIALEEVKEDAWNERVYIPEIVNRGNLLRKAPSY